ncbi:MAG TPA: hypothetical protein VIK61_19905 [Acidimicrobiia bacterium]
MRRFAVVFFGLMMMASAMVTGGGLLASPAEGLRADTATLTGTGGATSQRSARQFASSSPGYVLAAADGGIFAFGRAFHGSAAGLALRAPIAGIAATPDGGGYWLVAADGGVFAFGDAHFYGSITGITLNNPVEGIAATPDGGGYWLVASDGGVFAFGDAHFHGRLRLLAPVVGIATTGDGNGYWLLTDNRQAFPFGDALAVLPTPFNYGYVAIARISGTTRGIVVVNIDGTRYTFNAKDAGCPPISPVAPAMNAGIVGIATVAPHCGEWLAGWDGGVFAFGAPFLGSAASLRLVARVVGIAS